MHFYPNFDHNRPLHLFLQGSESIGSKRVSW